MKKLHFYLILFIIILFITNLINFLKLNKNIEKYESSDDLEFIEDSSKIPFGDLQDVQETIIDANNNQYNNNNIVDKVAEETKREYDTAKRNETITTKNLLKEQERIKDFIKSIDDLNKYYTVGSALNRKIDPRYKNKRCVESNLDFSGISSGTNSIKACIEACNKNPDCLSFNYFKGSTKKKPYCKLSSLCSLNNTKYNRNFDLYLKKNVPIPSSSNYILNKMKKCDDNKVTLGVFNNTTLSRCSQKCTSDTSCISFDYNNKNKTCRLSKDCYNQNAKFSKDHNLYVDKELSIRPYVVINRIPCQRKFLLIFNYYLHNNSHGSLAITNIGNSGRVRVDRKTNDDIKQIFTFDDGFIKLTNGLCMYYDDNGNGPSNDLPIKFGKCPTTRKKNYLWSLNSNGTITTTNKNKNNNKIYAVNLHGLKFNRTYNGGHNTRNYTKNRAYSYNYRTVNSSQLKLNIYNSRYSTRWLRKYI